MAHRHAHYLVKGVGLEHPDHGSILVLYRMLTGSFVCAHYDSPEGIHEHWTLQQLKDFLQVDNNRKEP